MNRQYFVLGSLGLSIRYLVVFAFRFLLCNAPLTHPRQAQQRDYATLALGASLRPPSPPPILNSAHKLAETILSCSECLPFQSPCREPPSLPPPYLSLTDGEPVSLFLPHDKVNASHHLGLGSSRSVVVLRLFLFSFPFYSRRSSGPRRPYADTATTPSWPARSINKLWPACTSPTRHPHTMTSGKGKQVTTRDFGKREEVISGVVRAGMRAGLGT